MITHLGATHLAVMALLFDGEFSDNGGASKSVMEQAEGDKLLLKVVVAGLVLAVIATMILPRLRQALNVFRTIASDKDDADLSDLKRQRDYMRQEVASMRDRTEMHDSILARHRAWDIGVVEGRIDPRAVPPPPLYYVDRSGSSSHSSSGSGDSD